VDRVLVISPGVLPLPPVLGGAVENLIARIHPGLADRYEMEYVSVRPPAGRAAAECPLNGSAIHYVDSINPLADFTADNQFELHESDRWCGYREFCARVCAERRPALVHVHNEAYLLPPLRAAWPCARLLLHVNDEVVTRMGPADLARLAEACDLILACSGYIARQMAGAFAAAGVRPPALETFYNFVDLDEYDPAGVGAGRSAEVRRRHELGPGPVVLFVGRMIEQKGPHLTLRAFRRVAGDHPDAHLLFVGAPWYSRPNDSPFVEAVRREAAGLDGRVRFTGYVDHADMPAYYAAADVVCAPSIWDDPSPFVAYEAQAMARPVLGSTRGGIPEIVADHETGRCIDPFNAPLFARVLGDWLGDPAARQALGARGRARVAERFDLRRARRHMRAVYDRLLAGA
jgi:spore coat protein SA